MKTMADLPILLGFISSILWMEIEMRPKNIVVPRFVEVCDEDEVKPHVEIQTLKINQYSKANFSVEIKLEFKHDLHSLIDMDVLITKCKSYADEGSCEFYNKVLMKKLTCGMIGMKNQIWTTLISNYEPPLLCPFKKGVYTSKTLYMDAREVAKWTTNSENYFWKVMLVGYDSTTKDKIFCCNAGVEVIRAS